MIVIRGGDVLTGAGWRRVDVWIEGSRVVALGDAPLHAETVVDATGCLVGPAFVDIHAHLREPGQTWKEDVASASRSAAAGGFGALVAMPNTSPPTDRPEPATALRAMGSSVGLVDVVPAGTLTLGRLGREASDIEGLYDVGVRIFSDDGDCVDDEEVMTAVARRIARLPEAILAQHAEDGRLPTGHLHPGNARWAVGIDSTPAEAEWRVIERDIELVTREGGRYHCQHLSSSTSVSLVAAAKAEGLAVTAEVTPHHLTHTTDDLSEPDTNLKMYPPLRTSADRDSLRQALLDGTIDAVATDHAPHAPEEKAVPFEEAPRGVIGLETAASVVWSATASPDVLFAVLSINPATLASLHDHGNPVEVGGGANLTVFDPAREWEVTSFESKSSNSPYLGATLSGRVVATIFNGGLSHLVSALT